MYDFRRVKGHVEVYLDGEFQFSADNLREAYEEVAAVSADRLSHECSQGSAAQSPQKDGGR